MTMAYETINVGTNVIEKLLEYGTIALAPVSAKLFAEGDEAVLTDGRQNVSVIVEETEPYGEGEMSQVTFCTI